ncbi:MAG: hypothetical protein L0Y58_20205 [Verrucomicrobia subdivision 3 bacterium]|nr:hypothetical protein [Limisphaerales bacterium]
MKIEHPRPCVSRSVVALAALFVISAFRATAGIPEPDLVWYGKVLVAPGDVVVRATTGTLAWQIEPMAGGTPWIVATRLTNINDQFSFILRVPCESPEPAVTGTSNTVVLTSPALSYRRLTVTLDGQPLTIQSAPTLFTPALADRGRTERIDLVLGTLPVDTDGDGLADDWEQLHFGSLAANPNDDPDLDGMSNFQEYRAGTDPKNASSRFALIEIYPLPQGMYLRWASQPNRRYKVRRASSLLASPSSYEVVQSGVLATPPFNEFIDTTVPPGDHFFYLLQIEE